MDAQNRQAVELVVYDARGNLRMTVSPAGYESLHVRACLMVGGVTCTKTNVGSHPVIQ